MDPYKILGVNKNATQEEIKNSYRKRAKALHPDLNPGNKTKETQFKELSEAYEHIETTEKREKFEKRDSPPPQGPFYHSPPPQGNRYSQYQEDMDPSIFEHLYRGSFKNQDVKYQSTHLKEDRYYSMDIDFNFSITGGMKEILLPTGKKLNVKVPAGIKSGNKIRLKGQGEFNSVGHPESDAYIEFHVLPSLLFHRIGNDLEIELPLSIQEAIMGGEVQVATVDGSVLLNIPPGVTTGSRIRIKGKGVPFLKTRGDLFAKIKIVMPPKIDTELKDFIKEWAKKNTYNPRSLV